MEFHIRTNGKLILGIKAYFGDQLLEKPIFEANTLALISNKEKQDDIWYILNWQIKNFEKRFEISKLKKSKKVSFLCCLPDNIHLESLDISDVPALKVTNDEFYNVLYFLLNIIDEKYIVTVDSSLLISYENFNKNLNKLNENNAL